MILNIIFCISIVLELLIIAHLFAFEKSNKINKCTFLFTLIGFILISFFLDSIIYKIIFSILMIIPFIYKCNVSKKIKNIVIFIFINLLSLILYLFLKSIVKKADHFVYFYIFVLIIPKIYSLFLITLFKNKKVFVFYLILSVVLLFLIFNYLTSYTLFILLSVLCISFIFLFYYFLDTKIKNNKKELAYNQKIKELKDIIDLQTYQSKELHNLKNELFAIEDELKNNYQSGLNRIEILSSVVEDNQAINFTGIKSIDSLINSKKTIMKINNIIFSCNSFFSSINNIETNDLTIIIGNLLDNAIESCLKLDKSRYIYLYFRQNGEYLNIILKNSYDINQSDLNTNKKNKYIHGFGLSSIYDLCYKYDGICIIEKNELFCISVLLINK